MRIQVRQFREDEEEGPSSVENLLDVELGGRSGCIRAEYPVADVEACQEPIMRAVFEDVACRHGRIAEAVDEDGFILAFQEVRGQHRTDGQLGGGGLREVLEVEIDVRPEREEEQCRNHQRTEIFDDEDGTPSYLGALEVSQSISSLVSHNIPRSLT